MHYLKMFQEKQKDRESGASPDANQSMRGTDAVWVDIKKKMRWKPWHMSTDNSRVMWDEPSDKHYIWIKNSPLNEKLPTDKVYRKHNKSRMKSNRSQDGGRTKTISPLSRYKQITTIKDDKHIVVPSSSDYQDHSSLPVFIKKRPNVQLSERIKMITEKHSQSVESKTPWYNALKNYKLLQQNLTFGK